MKILVTGATGGLGSEIIDILLTKTAPGNLAGLVRTPEKATALAAKGVEVRMGDYNDPATLVAAFSGIDKLYFISGSDIMARREQHRHVVRAAAEAGVKHLVYTSFDRKTEDGTSAIAAVAADHLQTEQWIRETGIPYTMMLHGLYLNFLPMFLGDKVLETGVIYQPSGNGKAAFTLRSDMAAAGAAVLTSAGHEGKTYKIVSEEALSYAEVAQQLSDLTGKTVRHVSPSIDEYIQTLTGLGVPAEHAGFFGAFAQAIGQGEFENTDSDIETLTGKKPVSVRTFLAQTYA